MLTLEKILRSKNPLDILRDDYWLKNNFTELLDLKSGGERGHKDNYEHTLQVLENTMNESDDIRIHYVALFHDLGKHPVKRYTAKNGWEFHGHEKASAKMLKGLYERFKIDISTYNFVYNIVLHHGETRNVFGNYSTDSAIRRLYKNLKEGYEGDPMDIIHAFVLFSKCDLTTKQEFLRNKVKRDADVFLERLGNILEEDAKRERRYSINGNDIIQTFGVKPGKDLGNVLNYIKMSIDNGRLPDDKEFLIDHIRKTFFKK